MTENKTDGSKVELLRLASNIVSAYVGNNSLPTGDLSSIIRSVHNTLLDIDSGVEGAGPDLTPAVPIKKSVTPDFIICLEDGKKLKMLKRYLRSQYGMTPEEYRARWGLPADYPMVAPNYAAQRSRLAKQIGLGRTATSAPRAKRKK